MRTRLIAGFVAMTSSLAACSPSTPLAPEDATPPASSTTTDLPAGILIGEAGAPTASAAAAGEATANAAAPRYSRAGIRPLDPACKDPRAVLGKAAFDDPTLAASIRRAVTAHAEFEVTAGPFSGPRQLTLWRADYGTKNFSAFTRPKNTYAVIAACADAATCLEFAAMVRSVVSVSAPVLFCGQPPAVSGGVVPL